MSVVRLCCVHTEALALFSIAADLFTARLTSTFERLFICVVKKLLNAIILILDHVDAFGRAGGLYAVDSRYQRIASNGAFGACDGNFSGSDVPSSPLI